MALTAKKVYAILKRQISDMEAKLNSPVRYRGTVATADLLPLNPDIGDMYNIESKSVYGEAGMNVAWNGVVWDTMGAPIDMSLYFKEGDIPEWALQPEKPTYTAEETGALPADTKIPSKTSDLQNDSGFLTKIPDNYLSGTDKTLSASGKAADAKVTGEKIAKNSSDITKKLDKNQGVENSGKIAGINESGDIVPMFPVGVEYNSETNCLEFGTDQKMKLNQGIGLDSSLTKTGYAADAGVVGEVTNSLKEDINYLQTKENIVSGQAINVGYDYLKKNSLTSNFELSGNGNFKLMYFSDTSDKNTYMDIEIGKTYLVMCKVSAEYSGNNVYSFALGMRDLHFIDYAFNRIYPSGTWYPSSNDTEIFTYGTVTITGDIAKAIPWIHVSNAGDSANYKYTVKNWGLFEYSANMDVSSLVEEFNNNSFADTYKRHYERKNVYCWGDSLTMGYGGNNVSYPSVLQSLLGNEYKVFNMGVGGESGDTIACRQGGMVAYLESDTTFTKNIATDFNAKTIYGVQIKPSRQLGNINGYILGNKGVVGWNNSTSMSTFTSTQTFTAKKGTPVIITQKITEPYLQIICIGQNGVGNVNVNPQSENNYKTWCEVIDTMQNSTNAITIVLSLLDGSVSYDNTVDLYAQKKYGGRYIKSRQELSKYGLSIVGITPTSQDIERMEAEKVPTSLFFDSVHLNAKGYTAWATIIYWHLKGMGLVN